MDMMTPDEKKTGRDAVDCAWEQNPDMKAMSIGVAIHIFIFGAPMALAACRLLEMGRQ